MKNIGVVAGSFDPVTNGHLWLIEQACRVMDELFVVVGVNASKKYLFTAEERVRLVKAVCSDLPLYYKINVVSYGGLLVHKALEVEANYIIRGIRTIHDFNYEQQIQQVNKRINPKVDTMFFVPPPEYMEVSSSTVKSLVGFPGWEDIVGQYVAPVIVEALKNPKKEC